MLKSDDTVILEGFDSLTSFWLRSESLLIWNCIFVLPPWFKVWWHEFGAEAELYLGAFRKGGTIAGIAPLLLRGTEASFIGSTDLCDYLDFVIVPGKEVDFFNILLDDLRGRGISRLNLRRLGEAGDVKYRMIEESDSLLDSMGLFLRLFRESRQDKAIFLTNRIESL